MTPRRLVLRSLTYYWRTNLAVVLGVATAVTVLAGALLVGDSVRGSLRDLVLQRLGRTNEVVVSSDFFRAQLADDLRADPAFAAGGFLDIAPIVAVPGLATDQASRRRSLGVQVYGIDDRFWRFHGLLHGSASRLTPGPDARDVWLSPVLARDLGAQVGGTILLRIQRPSAIPLDSLHGEKDDLARTLRVTLRGVLAPAELGEFSLQPQQGDVRAAFVPLSRLQQELDLPNRVNALIVSTASTATPAHNPVSPKADAALQMLVRRHAQLEDLGLSVRELEDRGLLSLEAGGTLITDERAATALAAATALGMHSTPVFTYLANSIRISGPQRVPPDVERAIPYSLVTAIDLETIAPRAAMKSGASPPIVLNDWAARDLGSRIGDEVTLEYFVWEDPGLLKTRSATFQVAAVVPISGAAADRDLAPVYPGITTSENLRDWNPPFPVDLRRVRPVDEEYWRTYRTTPKAFIPLEVGQSLWQSRHGSFTSIRVAPPSNTPLGDARRQYTASLQARLNPFANGLSAHDARSEGLAASRGATDFGEYFAYFSFFLVASALVLAVLFFKLGVEQRGREVGLLRAVGFTPSLVRRLFALEGLLVSFLGSLVGLLGAIGYGYLMMVGLRTWWVDAVGTTALTLHVTATSLVAGGVGGVLAAIASIFWTLRSVGRLSDRSLLSGRISEDLNEGRATSSRRWGAGASAACLLALGVLLIAGSLAGRIDRTGAFFGAGTALLASCLCLASLALRTPSGAHIFGHGWVPLVRLGLRNATHRPARSVLSIAVMASATFVLISVDAFRTDDRRAVTDPHSGTGGYALLVNMMLPIVHDPNSTEGLAMLGLTGPNMPLPIGQDPDSSTGPGMRGMASLPDISVTPFRVLPGDDASCLNLYEPRQPRIIGASAAFVAAGRFSFQSSLARSDAERANPWRLLDRPPDTLDRAVPVIADANSMTYVLHKSLGDDIVLSRSGGSVRLRIVAALADSLFQGELLMSDANFVRLFPEQAGYQFLLVDAPAARATRVASIIEDRLSDAGADAVPAAQRLAEFHKVENTYLSTFQTLGGLGLLLGTIGLAAVLLRNVLERRRELALLSAVGYRRAHIFTIVIAENALLLVAGLVAGSICALIAITPAAIERGGRLPTGAGAWLLLFGVLVTGLLSSFVATRATLQTRLLNALKAE